MSDILKQMQREQIELLQQRVEEIKNTNQQQYDEGYKHGLAFAEARERVLREALEKILWLRPAGPTRNKFVEQIEIIARAALSAHKEGK